MDNYKLSFDILQYRLKSARRKKRLQKTDFDKQLIQVVRKREELCEARKALPMIPLEVPYQKGWKRHFVLREDIKRSPSAEFYQSILDKINTAQYSADQSFKKIKGFKRRKRKTEMKQFLRDPSESEWNRRSQPFTEEEKAHFHAHSYTSQDGKQTRLIYRFNEPWHYELQITPYIITKVKMVDELLERELKYIDNWIKMKNAWPRICNMSGGRYRYQKWRKINSRVYRNTLYRTALASYIEECEYKKHY